MGESTISPSTISWTMRLRKARLRRASPSANSAAVRDPAIDASTRWPVIARVSASKSNRWISVSPPGPDVAETNPCIRNAASAASGGVRRTCWSDGSGTATSTL